jgi:hypothetical protein
MNNIDMQVNISNPANKLIKAFTIHRHYFNWPEIIENYISKEDSPFINFDFIQELGILLKY